MACCGCSAPELRGPIYRVDIRRIKRAIDAFNAGSPTRRCQRSWPDCDTTSKREAGSKTWRDTSTGPTFRRKKGGPRWPLSRGECHEGHGYRRPQWSSTRSLSCERKSIRQCAHRANSRRCFRGQATAPLDRRPSLGCGCASATALGRTQDRPDRAEAWRSAAESTQARRTQAPPLQATLARRIAVLSTQTISPTRHPLGAEGSQLLRLPSTRELRPDPSRSARKDKVMRHALVVSTRRARCR